MNKQVLLQKNKRIVKRNISLLEPVPQTLLNGNCGYSKKKYSLAISLKCAHKGFAILDNRKCYFLPSPTIEGQICYEKRVNLLILDVTVDLWVPERGLVTITPEEVFVSDVLEFVFLWPFVIWDFSQMSNMFHVFLFDKVGVDSGQTNGWQSNKECDFFP